MPPPTHYVLNTPIVLPISQGLKELLDEGAVQLLRVRGDDGSGTPLLAAVGQLQFEEQAEFHGAFRSSPPRSSRAR